MSADLGPRERHGRIVRLSGHLAARLAHPSHGTARVHAVFARAINIEGADGRLLTLHEPGPLRAPFAAAVERVASLRGQRPGAPVAIEPGSIRLPGLLLAWEQATSVDCAVATSPPGLDRAVVDALRRLDIRHAPGLDSPRGVAARASLSAAIGSRDASRLIAAASDLLGLGEGVTPAGDDCLVGVLAVLHAVGRLVGTPGLVPAVARAAADRTTAVGREFVIHALAGRFSEPVLAVLRARTAPEAAAAAALLACLGATSGGDTLTGMRLACRAAA